MALFCSIGPFDFLDLIGSVQLPQPRAETLQRPGVSGTGFKLVGTFGEEFTLHSRSDAFTLADAHDAGVNYQAIANDGQTYVIVKHGIDYSAAYGVVFAVRAVRNIRPAFRSLAVGGLFPPSLGWIEADWTLIAIPV